MRAHRIRAKAGQASRAAIRSRGRHLEELQHALQQAQDAAEGRALKLAHAAEQVGTLEAQIATLRKERDAELREVLAKLEESEIARAKAVREASEAKVTIKSLEGRLLQAETGVSSFSGIARQLQSQLESANRATQEAQNQYRKAASEMARVPMRPPASAPSQRPQAVVAPLQPASPRAAWIEPPKPRYSANAVDEIARMVAEGPSVRDLQGTKAEQAKRRRQEGQGKLTREALLEFTDEGNAARLGVLQWNYQNGYDPEADQLVLLKIREMHAENELALHQEISRRRVTARAILPGTDLIRVAALWAIEARMNYLQQPAKGRQTPACWRQQYFSLDDESEEDLQAELAKAIIQHRQKLRL